jgi:hypothetical protein
MHHSGQGGVEACPRPTAPLRSTLKLNTLSATIEADMCDLNLSGAPDVRPQFTYLELVTDSNPRYHLVLGRGDVIGTRHKSVVQDGAGTVTTYMLINALQIDVCAF